MAILDPITSLPQFRGGRIEIFAVTAKGRTVTAPEIPTVDEAGAPGLHSRPGRRCGRRRARRGTSSQTQRRSVSTLNDPAIRNKFAEQSYEVGTREEQTPEYLGKFHKAEIERWWPIIKAAGIKAE